MSHIISFHDLLSRYINEKQISVAKMADYCMMERSSLYRIIRGQRTPANEDVVHQMATYLCLNPAEEDAMMLSYQVELIGYETYSRRQYIDDFIRSFHTAKVINDLYSPAIKPMENRQIFAQPMDSRNDVIRIFHNAVTSEALQKGGGHVRLFLPPDVELMSILSAAAAESSVPLRVDHLIQLFQGSNVKAASNENFKMVLNTLPMVSRYIDYRPHYFYSEVIPSLPLFFPYQIFTHDTVFWISEDLCGGLVVHHPTILPFMKSQFDRSLQQCHPLYHPQTLQSLSSSEYARYFTGLAENSIVHMLSFPPMSVDRKAAEAHIKADIPDRDTYISLFSPDMDSYQRSYETACKQLLLSRSGLEHFSQSGLLPRYPRDIYMPLTPDERRNALQRIINVSDKTDVRVLKNDVYNISDGISFAISDNYCCVEIYFGTDFSRYLVISEPNFLDALKDYFESRTDQDLYSPEDSREIILDIIAAIPDNES